MSEEVRDPESVFSLFAVILFIRPGRIQVNPSSNGLESFPENHRNWFSCPTSIRHTRFSFFSSVPGKRENENGFFFFCGVSRISDGSQSNRARVTGSAIKPCKLPCCLPNPRIGGWAGVWWSLLCTQYYFRPSLGGSFSRSRSDP